MNASFLVAFFRRGPTASLALAAQRSAARVGIALALVFGFASLSGAAPAAGEKSSVRVLAIGNSFTEDATAFLPDVAKAGGKELVILRTTLGGCSLARHALHLVTFQENPNEPWARPYRDRTDPVTGKKRDFSLPEALAAVPWDAVTIQQLSWQSRDYSTYQPYANLLLRAIHEHAPKAEVLIHETWAYREDHEWFRKGDGYTQEAMYAAVRSAYHQLAQEIGSRIIPTGDAFQLARRSEQWRFVPDTAFDYQNPPAGQLPKQRGGVNVGWYLDKDDAAKTTVLRLDATHSNVAGRYLGAVSYYLVLFGADEAPAGYTPPGLSPEEAASLRGFAEDAVAAERKRVAAAAR